MEEAWVEEILKKLEKADAAQIDTLLDMMIRRKRELYPDWEIVYYARKKNEPDDLTRLLPLLRRET